MPTTIKSVAAAAGVSPATVSRVLNGNTDVGSDLKARVLAAVSELGYRPNGAARSLRTRATLVLGIIISDITNPFFTALVRGMEDAAQEAGYSVVLANADEDLGKESRYLEVAAAEQMAGVVLSPASSTQTRLDVLTERNIPVVTIDRRIRAGSACPQPNDPASCIACRVSPGRPVHRTLSRGLASRRALAWPPRSICWFPARPLQCLIYTRQVQAQSSAYDRQ